RDVEAGSINQHEPTEGPRVRLGVERVRLEPLPKYRSREAKVLAGDPVDHLRRRHLQTEAHMAELGFRDVLGDVAEHQRLADAWARHPAEHLAGPKAAEDVVQRRKSQPQ